VSQTYGLSRPVTWIDFPFFSFTFSPAYKGLKLTIMFQISSMLFFFYLVFDVISTAATPGLLCHPRVIVKMIVKKQMECGLARETEVLGENLPRRHFCPSQNPT
jgi:hypothetical protein